MDEHHGAAGRHRGGGHGHGLEKAAVDVVLNLLERDQSADRLPHPGGVEQARHLHRPPGDVRKVPKSATGEAAGHREHVVE